MTLSELTDRGAVLAAIDEFDRIGRDTFLAKYGFKAARSYFLVHQGTRYDSKALVAAAFGFQAGSKGPLKASEFSGGEATVGTRLKRLGFEVEFLDNVPNSNPNWTREETILALDLLVRRKPTLPGEEDKDIVELSKTLKLYAKQRGVKGNEKFRNPAGVSMKVANLSRLDNEDKRDGLSHGAKIEAAVWAEFMPDTGKLAIEANAIRRSIGVATSLPPPPAKFPKGEQGAKAGDESAVSRGPRPSFGPIVHDRQDGENSVYIMRLTGRLEGLFPKRRLTDMAIIKVGRTNDVKRRAEELNAGFPPGLALAWQAVCSKIYKSANEAHDAEQAILSDLNAKRLSIGREFAIVPTSLIKIILL